MGQGIFDFDVVLPIMGATRQLKFARETRAEDNMAAITLPSLLFLFGAEGATPPETLRQKDRETDDILESRVRVLNGATFW